MGSLVPIIRHTASAMPKTIESVLQRSRMATKLVTSIGFKALATARFRLLRTMRGSRSRFSRGVLRVSTIASSNVLLICSSSSSWATVLSSFELATIGEFTGASTCVGSSTRSAASSAVAFSSDDPALQKDDASYPGTQNLKLLPPFALKYAQNSLLFMWIVYCKRRTPSVASTDYWASEDYAGTK
ncbi:unnamed protein product [Parnassius apollo]|uniref:(apollo) hypothetical protein n=1 Tax=Parnassius apollo TaxID=110799 RepID=A0A8S3WUL2_PARAO|nr:unnamed protein product [Parnassius apollo]